ncbi:MAG: hypothetical protein ACE5GT_06740 [Rhodospirillales bacterium]
MSILFYVFAGAAGIAAALATIAIWAPRPTRVRLLAVAVTTLFLPLVYVQMAEMLSRPKPAPFEWYERQTKEAVVLGVSLDEGESIYLWLRLADSIEPRYYVVPWNLRLAERLEEALDEAIQSNAMIVLQNPFYRRSLEQWGDLNVDIIPPPLPPQKLPPLPPRLFNPRDPGI